MRCSQNLANAPTRVLPRERRRLSGFAHGPAFVALGQRVAFLLPHNKPSASMLRVNNASPFYLVTNDTLFPVSHLVGLVALILA
jgi:hypothetical protein